MGQNRVGFYTLGCKVSQYETEAVAEAFEKEGFVRTPFSEPCDVYVINTCTVTQESDRKSRQVIRRALKQNSDALVMVTGCYAQTSPLEIASIRGVCYVSGSDGKMRLPQRARELLASRAEAPLVEVGDIEKASFEPMCITHAPRTRAYVKIEDGCECRCTYCAIPGARGSVRSKPMEDVLREVESLAAGGSREIVLTGIETASWGRDLGELSLIDLLEELDRRPSTPRIRLGSLSPELIRPEFVARFVRLTCVTPHLHLSMQSGSDDILRAMRRRYNTAMAKSSLADLRAACPGITFTTDMMVGFPGENARHFEETLDFCREAKFLDIHVFAYSRRKGTPAADFPDQVPEEEKHARSARLITLKNEIRATLLEKTVREGKPLPVLFETLENGFLHGHSDRYMEVSLPYDGEDLRGEIALVRPVRAEGGIIYAEK